MHVWTGRFSILFTCRIACVSILLYESDLKGGDVNNFFVQLRDADQKQSI